MRVSYMGFTQYAVCSPKESQDAEIMGRILVIRSHCHYVFDVVRRAVYPASGPFSVD